MFRLRFLPLLLMMLMGPLHGAATGPTGPTGATGPCSPLPAAKGGIIRIDIAGDYCASSNISDLIVIDADNVSLDLQGYTAQAGIRVGDLKDGYQNFTIKNGTVENPGGYALHVYAGCSGGLIQSITSQNCNTGIYLSDKVGLLLVSNITVTSITCAGPAPKAGTGIYIGKAADGIVINGTNSITNMTTGVLIGQNADVALGNITFSGCTNGTVGSTPKKIVVEDATFICDTYALDVTGSGDTKVYVKDATSDKGIKIDGGFVVECEAVTIVGDIAHPGLEFNVVEGVSVVNVEIDGCDAGIKATDVKSFIIDPSIIKNNTGKGLDIALRVAGDAYISVDKVTVEANGGAGIEVTGGSDDLRGNIKRCLVQDNGDIGIKALVKNIAVVANEATNNNGGAIAFADLPGLILAAVRG